MRQATHETGLAKTDACNHTHTGGIATISANRVASGDVIAGDALIEKGVESGQGNVTYIDYDRRLVPVNGRLGDPTTGVMVRINDPDSRHTLQTGPGCAPGSPNCSADPRFTLDADNYTNVFTSGYPLCIPSTVRSPGERRARPTSAAAPARTPTARATRSARTRNRGNRVAADSRRMAPIAAR